MTAARMIALTAIDLDDRAWPRQRLHQERVEEFARSYSDDGPFALDPILVVPRETGRYLLVNGRHRLAARKLMKADDVAAIVGDSGGLDPIAYAYEYALTDSARSSLPLTRAEKQQAVFRLLHQHPERTDVAIAAMVGVSSKTVQRARKWLTEHPDGATTEAAAQERWQPPTARDVAATLARQLDRLWFHRPFGMAVGISDSAKLGDALAEAFIDRVGVDEAVEWTERLRTWAIRAHQVTVTAAEAEQ